MRRAHHYDVSYAAVLLDHLTDRQTVALVHDYYGLLSEGGALILGSPTTGIPASETTLIAWVLDLAVHYRDEPDSYNCSLRRPLAPRPCASNADRWAVTYSPARTRT